MSKLEYLIRQNKRKRTIKDFSQQLSQLLNTAIEEDDFLNIEQTDLLTGKFYESYKNSENRLCKKYPSKESEKIEKSLKALYVNFYNKFGYLIIKQTEDCGLLKFPINEILEKYKQLVELDGNSLCILSTDESEGIYLDYFEESNNSITQWYYELSYWKL